MLVLDRLARVVLSLPDPLGPDFRDDVSVYAAGIGAISANLYLALANGKGKSVGKWLTGLRLVVVAGHQYLVPGVARGLIRSALQAGPGMGFVMLLTGVHDVVAGTSIVRSLGHAAEGPRQDGQAPTEGFDTVLLYEAGSSGVGLWNLGGAILLHLFFAAVYMVVSAL